MEADNLRTASLYINNQLLSRGLLRNGQNIDFSRPEKGEGGLEATMGRIMSVVNDLILRRDRDATQRESLSTTIHTLRADALRQTTDLERVSTKHVEAQRKLGIAEATERAMKQQLKTADIAQRGLKEEMGKMKLLVQQTRNQCAVEVRKRERVMEGLKKQVGEGGRPRGGGKVVGVREITVIAGVGAEQGNSGAMSVGVSEEGYDLRSETNEFLTELARGLSEENENLTSLVRRTVETLRTLSGCESTGTVHENGMVIPTEMGYENLATETEAVVEHVKNLLTNPSFVPLEEVEIREEEICRLREGWERMESRWRDAVQMMDGWRKRMARSGQTVNLEELKMGLMLSPLKPKEDENAHLQLSMVMEEGEGDTQADIDAMDESEIVEPVDPDCYDSEDSESSLFADEPMEEMPEEPFEEQEEQRYQEQDFSLNSASSMSVELAPQLSPLRETSGNRPAISSPKEKEGFTTIVEENTYDLLQLANPSPQRQKTTPQSNRRNHSPGKLSTPPDDEVSLLRTSNLAPKQAQRQARSRSSSPQKPAHTQRLNVPTTPKLQAGNGSRLPRPREALPQQSPLTMATIAAKLAASEREADAARVRAKIKAARMGRNASATSATSASSSRGASGTELDAVKLMPPPASGRVEEPAKNKEESGGEERGELNKRKRKAAVTGRSQGGRANRRRSTLSPWELESLILGGVRSGEAE